jgi:hypothetical protein
MTPAEESTPNTSFSLPPILQGNSPPPPHTPTQAPADIHIMNQSQVLLLLDNLTGPPTEPAACPLDHTMELDLDVASGANLAAPLTLDNAPRLQEDPPIEQSSALQEVIAAVISQGEELDPDRPYVRHPKDKYTKAQMPKIQDSHLATLSMQKHITPSATKT